MRRNSGAGVSLVHRQTRSSRMHSETMFALGPSVAPGGSDADGLGTPIGVLAGLHAACRRRTVEASCGPERPAWAGGQRFDFGPQFRPVGVAAPGGPRKLDALHNLPVSRLA